MKGKTILERLRILDCLQDTYRDTLKEDARRGLTAPRKFLPSKYFYDDRGSRLFREICRLPEYYLTRTELLLLRRSARSIMGGMQAGDIIELGSGENRKIRMLLDAVHASCLPSLRYVPIDVSAGTLLGAARELLHAYPGLRVCGVVADFTRDLARHLERISFEDRMLLTFFGSTLGNFTEEESLSLLQNVARILQKGDLFLLGVDRVKRRDVLESAYNDRRGITSAFNKNILHVLNRELHAHFPVESFDHLAFYNEEEERVEMHLRAVRRLSVAIEDLEEVVEIEEGETILTEICRKFSREKVERMCSATGLSVLRWHSDAREWFSLVELAPCSAEGSLMLP
ncbi:MAG: L-histidine N(alpha)-methyltransferase [Alphaproteobacteria bacterium]|uniref:L-histidine N(Alpha)-methyltransferase n=1 Tax=Candidatus Nitrobium versatile TaxID=2884831 RepID=A0A953M1U0_9BACT|nr:L-histidine N(alpha)-methyltransferase [Candidatus Nitrobium versatile]